MKVVHNIKHYIAVDIQDNELKWKVLDSKQLSEIRDKNLKLQHLIKKEVDPQNIIDEEIVKIILKGDAKNKLSTSLEGFLSAYENFLHEYKEVMKKFPLYTPSG